MKRTEIKIHGATLMCRAGNVENPPDGFCEKEMLRLVGKLRSGENREVLPRLDQSSGYNKDVDGKGTHYWRLTASQPRRTFLSAKDLVKKMNITTTLIGGSALSRNRECFSDAESCFSEKQIAEISQSAALMVCLHLELTESNGKGGVDTTYQTTCFEVPKGE